MRVPRMLTGSFFVLVFLLSIAPLAGAQQYTIIRADYGWGDQRVDVTGRLRDLARANLTFRMGNSTFGIDPAPGHVKTLRIYARSPRGRDKMFEYREGSTVDGSIFSGWRGGNWGGGGPQGDRGDQGHYVILRAFYGVPGSNVDVTDRLRQLARADITFRMGNSTFGVDPAHGVVKTLRIFARGPDGRVRMFEYREGSVVDGSDFIGWGRGDWGKSDWHGGWDGEGRPH